MNKKNSLGNVNVLGIKELKKDIKRLSKTPNKIKDIARKSAIKFDSIMKTTTPRLTGKTASAWIIKTKRISTNSIGFSVQNPTGINKEYGNKSLIRILDEGRGEIRPKKARRLYIPFTNKGRSKKLRSKIPKNLKFGVDYVLAKRAKPTRPKNFIKAGIDITLAFIKKSITNILRDI